MASTSDVTIRVHADAKPALRELRRTRTWLRWHFYGPGLIAGTVAGTVAGALVGWLH